MVKKTCFFDDTTCLRYSPDYGDLFKDGTYNQVVGYDKLTFAIKTISSSNKADTWRKCICLFALMIFRRRKVSSNNGSLLRYNEHDAKKINCFVICTVGEQVYYKLEIDLSTS